MLKSRRIFQILLRAAGILLSLALMAAAAFALILAQPQDKKAEAVSPAPLQASPALSVQSESDLPELIRAFPAPVMSFMSGSGMTFVSASASDKAVNGQFCRVAVLNWQTPDGQPFMLQSVYPASAVDLLKGNGFHFSPVSGSSLFGHASVRMENSEAVRLHVQTDEGLYVVTVPLGLSDRLSGLCQSLQLFSVSEEEVPAA